MVWPAMVWPVRGSCDGTVLGTSPYLEVPPGDTRLEVGATGYSPAVWAPAVNPATRLLLLGLSFEQLHVSRVELKTDIRNLRSQRAIARPGTGR